MKTTTRVRKVSRRQRGVALLIALFALLLLSCIGLGMMYSADTETSINANYKDKEAAIYAANAGLEEVKDRLLQGGSGDISAPSALPSLAAANIIYVLNPGASETVGDIRPWDYTNAYADTELCQNNILGLTRSLGTPCTGSGSLPSGSTWYSTVNNTGHWSTQLSSTPLNYKWVRLQLKANNTTPFAVNGSSSDATEVCWDGLHQIPLPAGYNTNCNPTGGVTVTLTNGGSGYTGTPTVTIGPPPAGGTQAVYTPVMTNVSGQVTQVLVGSPGTGYDPLNPPVVTIAPPTSGTTATATANVIASGGSLTGVTSVTPNTGCYTANPGAIAVPGGVTTGNFTVAMTATECIAGITFPAQGKKCSGNMTITGGTSNATVALTYAANGAITSGSISNPGAGYAATPGASAFTGVTCTGGGSSPPTISVTMGHQVVSTGAAINSSGSGYASSSYTVSIPGNATGTAASAVIAASASNPNAGQISGFTVTNPGSGYTLTPPVVVVAPPASGTTATATANTNATQVVSGFTMVNSGSGYLTSPSVTITAPGGSGTTATAVAQVASGPFYSPVIMLTALGQTKQGGRAMTQMEVAYEIRSLTLPGALTMAGPTPSYGSPNSNNFYISGIDHPNGSDGSGTYNPPGCSGTATASHPAIGVYDDPNNPTSPSSVDTLLAPGVLQPDPSHYPGVSGSPDVQNVYGALGLNSPSDFDQLVTEVAALTGAHVIPSNTLSMGTAASPAINVNYGNLTLNGNTTGYGILVVTGVLTFQGNFTWNGIVMAIGQGDIEFGGGGGGTINGSVILAKTKDSSGNELASLGTPTLNWSGGGGNGIYYDHCWADGLLSEIPLNFPTTNNPLKILSVRTMPY